MHFPLQFGFITLLFSKQSPLYIIHYKLLPFFEYRRLYQNIIYIDLCIAFIIMYCYNTEKEVIRMFSKESVEVWKNLPNKKQTIIATLNNASGDIVSEMRNNPQHTLQYYNALLSLLDKVILEISSRNIFDAPEGWFYSFEVTNKSASLYIRHINDIQEDEDGNLVLDIDERFRLINYPVKLLTVEQFAIRSKIEEVTVRQWIRRGKLRNAIKVGGEWRIPEITDPPTRGFTPVRYYNNGHYLSLPKEIGVSINQNPCVIDINKSKAEKGYLILFDYVPAFIHEKVLTDAEREKIELMLISNSNITNSASVVGTWPKVKEVEKLVSNYRSGAMRLPDDWNENLF